MTNRTHTPTPWEFSDDEMARLISIYGEANAAFIVKAVNSHSDLVDALKFYANPSIYKAHPHGIAFDDRDRSHVAKSALAKAGAA
jgi:hypothetical protein